MMSRTFSPIDGSLYLELLLSTQSDIEQGLAQATHAQKHWQSLPIAVRAEKCEAAIAHLLSQKSTLAEEITRQMGRPIRYTPGEIDTMAARARYMIEQAESSLAPMMLPLQANDRRMIEQRPLGNIFIVAPWNYPYLTAVNSIIPALMAGNAVIFKSSTQTPRVGQRFFEAFTAAGMPEHLFQHLVLSHEQTLNVMQHPQIHYGVFTGSVNAGANFKQAIATQFKSVGLELGGKDAAYVCRDCDFDKTVESLVDGAFFNSGQSCCGIERIYVDQAIFKPFVDAFAALTRQYQLGNPLSPDTTLGPMVSKKAAQFVRDQIAGAIGAGAQVLIDQNEFADSVLAENYLPPQVLINVDHQMSIMRDETFGPAIGIMAVNDDDEALTLMNDSPFGLTASVWTQDEDRAIALGRHVDVGTWFMNRCDYLDPALPWRGDKDSGMGVSLSSLAYRQLTKTQAFYLRS